jgi:hypothetical protein
VDTNDCPSEREYLSVAEGLNLINDKNIGSTYVVDDLIYKAAIGQLIIYVLTNDWSASQIYEIDHSKPNTDLKIRFTGPKEPPFPNSKDMEELERQTLTVVSWLLCSGEKLRVDFRSVPISVIQLSVLFVLTR